MLGSGTELVGIFRLFSSVRYFVLPGAVWCGAVHTFSHTLLPMIHEKFAQNDGITSILFIVTYFFFQLNLFKTIYYNFNYHSESFLMIMVL